MLKPSSQKPLNFWLEKLNFLGWSFFMVPICQPVRTESHPGWRCCSDRANCCFPFLFCTWNSRAAADGADSAEFELCLQYFTSPFREKNTRGMCSCPFQMKHFQGKTAWKHFPVPDGSFMRSWEILWILLFFVEPMGKLYYIQISPDYPSILVLFPEWGRPKGTLLTLKLELGVRVLASHQWL